MMARDFFSHEILAEFLAYYGGEPAWGSLHLVMDDGNVADEDVESCIVFAIEEEDHEAERLARLLRTLKPEERSAFRLSIL